MIIGGVDLGVRKAAIAVFVNGELTNCADLEIPPSDRARELRTLAYWARTNLKVCDSIYVEEPLVGRGVRASLQIAQVAGAIVSEMASSTPHIDLVSNTAWKKALLGNGNANKQDITAWLQTQYPSYASMCQGSQDRRDATCVGLYGVRIHDRARGLGEL